MNAERWRQIEEAFHGALERPAAERAAFLDGVCGADRELRAEVDRLLASAEPSAQDLKAVVGRAAAAFAAPESENLVGASIGRFRIVRKLGEGGMGAVYLAVDERLGRQVALKVVPEALGHDSGRLRRFELEARAVSALNHPNILTLHDIERSGERIAIVTEFVDGETLAERIARGPLALPDLLDLGAQIADALAEAHRAGIVHRDVKPTNVMVSNRGAVKVLDFGLAKMLPELGRESSEEPPKTASGMILGTVHYMSPEQATAREVDRRSDLFSLGVVLFEMVTGRRPFAADSAVETMQRILAVDPGPMAATRADVPAELERIVAKCLEKETAWRYQDADALAHDLRALRRALASGAVAPVSAASRATHDRARTALPLAIAGVALLVAVAIVLWSLRRPERATEPTPTFLQLTTAPGDEELPTISPDGGAVVYVARGDLQFQRFGGQNAVNLTPDTPSIETQPAFSPDGERIAFRSSRDGGGIFVMGATGESVRRLTDFGFSPAWSPDGRTLAIVTEGIVTPSQRNLDASELWLVTVATGERRRIVVPDAVQPAFSPDGRWIAFAASRTGRRDVWVVPAIGGEPIAVTADAAVDWCPVWAPQGGELYFASDRGGAMSYWRVRIDARSGRPRGEPVPFLLPGTFVSALAFSKDGRRAAYSTRSSSINVHAWGFDARTGEVTDAGRWLTRGSHALDAPAVSPDGESIVVSGQADRREDLFLVRRDGTGLRRLTDDEHRDRRPDWTPDGQRVVFYSNRSGPYELWSIRPDGGDLRRELSIGRDIVYPKWSPDGRLLAFCLLGGNAHLLDRALSPEPRALPLPPGDQVWFVSWAWSPDGRRLAGWRGATHRAHGGILLWSLDDDSYRELTEEGTYPAWLGDGRRLLFSRRQSVVLLDTDTGAERELLNLAPDSPNVCDLAPDGATLYCDRERSETDVWVLERGVD